MSIFYISFPKLHSGKGNLLKQKFKILSIDGGGIKGLYSAVILAYLEEKYGPLYQYFQMLCGTSTGGIIALALSIGVPAKKIVQFYENMGPVIFKKTPILSSLKQFFFKSKYNNNKLKDVLYGIFQDKKLKDSKILLCIPAVDLTNQKPVVFKTPHHNLFNRDGNKKMVDIALATSAAPGYFPAVSVNKISHKVIDGGIWQNNPAMIGLIEANSFFVGPNKNYEHIDLLSLGNIAIPISGFIKMQKCASLLNWNIKLLQLLMDIQSTSMDYTLKIMGREKIFNLNNYIRIIENNLSIDEQKLFKLDNASKKALSRLKDKALKKAYDLTADKNIQQFFDTKVANKEFIPFREGNNVKMPATI